MKVYTGLAATALALHLLWIVWVVLGWLVTRDRPWLFRFHILSLVYSIVIEIGPWPCPLTLAEQWFLSRAGIASYREPFLIHYLEALVYPNVTPGLLTACAVGVCLAIRSFYGWRFRRRGIAGW